MSLVPKIISAGFATCAIASATMPAFSANDWDVSGVEWYVDMDRAAVRASRATAVPDRATAQSQPAQAPQPNSQEAFIWAPGRYSGPAR